MTNQLEKKLQFSIKVLTYIKNNGNTKSDEIANVLGLNGKMAKYYCLELKRTGVLGSKKGPKGGYFIKETPKVKHILLTLGYPKIKTKNKETNDFFEYYLEKEIL